MSKNPFFSKNDSISYNNQFNTHQFPLGKVFSLHHEASHKSPSSGVHKSILNGINTTYGNQKSQIYGGPFLSCSKNGITPGIQFGVSNQVNPKTKLDANYSMIKTSRVSTIPQQIKVKTEIDLTDRSKLVGHVKKQWIPNQNYDKYNLGAKLLMENKSGNGHMHVGVDHETDMIGSNSKDHSEVYLGFGLDW